MNYRLLFFCIISFSSLFSQNQYYKEFKEILNTTVEISIKEKELDLFLLSNAQKMPKEELADCYHEYGKWFYQQSKITTNTQAIKKAILHTKKAAEIKQKITNIAPKSLIKTLFNLSFFNNRDNNFFESIDIYSKIIEINKDMNKSLYSYIGLGKIYNNIGDLHKGLQSFSSAIAYAKKDVKYNNRLIEGYLGRIDTYSLMGYEKYSDFIKADIEKINIILSKTEINKFAVKHYKNRIHHIEGNRLLKTKNYKKANHNFHKAIKGLSINDSLNLAKGYNSLGLSFLHLKEIDSSKFYLQKSILHASKFTWPYENMGDLYLTQQKFTKALLAYQKAIDYAVFNNKESAYDDLVAIEELEIATDKYYLLGHLIQKANGWVSYYHHDQNKDHLRQALRTFKVADHLVDIIRFESTEYKSKLFWREQGASLYMKAVETCYLLDLPEDAYYFMEKNKALLLLEDITNEQAKENSKLPVVLAKREFELKQAIHFSENELNIAKNNPKDSLQFLKDQIYRHKRIYERFVDSISQAYPKYAANKKKITVLPYKTFRTKYISDQELVLQYIFNKNQGYGLLTSSNKSIFFEIDQVAQLQQSIQIIQKQSSNWFSDQEQLSGYHKNAHVVFKRLVPQVVFEAIKGKKITIVPDHTLQQLSFDTLVTSEQDHSYLIKDTEIRYIYSVSYLDRNDKVLRDPKYSFMGIAPVTFSSKDLGDLTLSKEEVTSITDLLNGNALLEEKATKSNFIDTIYQYKVIHLSTHADIGTITTPWIALRDSKLSLNEIYATKNQSDMVVLSACKTSLGKLQEGEGIMSLARGFFHSGAKSVVSSLWATNDKSSKELMIDFYKELDKGLTKSAALRNAKLNYINSHTGSELSPFYWGSLILIGDNTSLSLSSNFFDRYWGAVLLATVILLLVMFFFLKRDTTFDKK